MTTIVKVFQDREFLKKLVGVALPLGLQSAVNMIVNLIDTIMVGTMGDIALSAVNIGMQFPYLAMTVGMGISNAALIIAAQAWGNNKPEKVKKIMAFVIKICIVIGIVFFLLSFLFPSQILNIYTDEANIINDGAIYLRILSFSILMQAVSHGIITILRTCGVNQLGFYASFAACLANVFFNWIFIFGNLGAPAMGLAGAALGTVMARITEFLIAFIYMLHDNKLGFRIPDIRLVMEPLMRNDLIKLGTPSLISEVTGNLNVSAAAMITGRVSAYYIAANSIIHNAWTLSSLFLFGIAMGGSVIIGHEIGAKHFDRAKEYSRYFIMIAFVIGIVSAVLTVAIAPFIINFFNVSEQTRAVAYELSFAAAIGILFNAFQIILTKGVLRGGGQAKAVTKVDLLSCWLVNIPAGILVALVLKADPFWIYLSLRIDYLIKTIWSYWKITKTNWILRMNVD